MLVYASCTQCNQTLLKKDKLNNSVVIAHIIRDTS